MKITVTIALALLSISLCSAQNTKIRWGAFSMGYTKSYLENTVLHSIGGQTVAGLARGSNTMIMSGFLADTLFQKVLVSVGPTEPRVPAAYQLAQNYPNPFNPSTTIHFELPTTSQVTLKVYNVLGQEVRTLINNEEKRAGRHSMRFDAGGLASGAYYYRMTAGDFVQTKAMMLVK